MRKLLFIHGSDPVNDSVIDASMVCAIQIGNNSNWSRVTLCNEDKFYEILVWGSVALVKQKIDDALRETNK